MPKNYGELAAEIIRLRKSKGLERKDVAEKCGVSYAYVATLETAKETFNPSSPFAKKFGALVGVPESHWLPFTEKGREMLRLVGAQTAPAQETAKPKLPTYHPVDLTDTVQIQDWGEVSAGEPRPQTEPKSVLIPKALVPNSSGTLVMFRVRGHSMTKRFIHEGSLLFVRIDPAPEVGEKVVAVVNSRKKRGSRGYVVKVLKQGAEWLELHSASEDDTAEPMIVDDTVEMIGVVEGILIT